VCSARTGAQFEIVQPDFSGRWSFFGPLAACLADQEYNWRTQVWREARGRLASSQSCFPAEGIGQPFGKPVAFVPIVGKYYPGRVPRLIAIDCFDSYHTLQPGNVPGLEQSKIGIL
jgi:hypothetical protein